jgi:hypothetical protein
VWHVRSGVCLQHSRRDVVQELQCRLRVSACVELVDACCRPVSRRYLQRFRRNGVQQLQRWLRVSGCVELVDAR